jgi:A/G-specific adenine glycosylase
VIQIKIIIKIIYGCFTKTRDSLIMTKKDSNNLSVAHRDIMQLQKRILTWYEDNARQLPRRETTDPYKIRVSEIMLQQTQVERVIPKYFNFLDVFPTIKQLARADKKELLLHRS